jgi:predicted amidohydrolase YtcJ
MLCKIAETFSFKQKESMFLKKIALFSLFGLLAATCFFWACAPTTNKKMPTVILYNGIFFTADSLQPQAQAVALLDDRILAVGADAEIRALAGPQTQQIDLKGAFGMPGFIEGHGHFSGLGSSLENINLIETKSWQEVVGQVQNKAQNTPAGVWIEGRGWHQEKWNQSAGRTFNGYPYHDQLSAAAPGHPVVLFHASGHALIANEAAMQLAGVNDETPDPSGGRIVRDAGGKLTGVFEENAMGLIERPLQAWKDQRPEAEKQAAFEKTIQLAVNECLRYGITSFQDAGSSFWELGQYRRMAESDKLGIRLWAMVAQPQQHQLEQLKDYPQIGLGKGHFTSRAVKVYFDGALGSYGAWLLQPYADNPEMTGQNTTALDSVAAIAAACRKHGLQLCVHAIGDRANREVLNLMSNPSAPRGLRWRIEHAQHIDPQDIPRFSELGITASMQAIHCPSDAPFVVKRLGVERARSGAYAWRSLLDAGARLANGTDAPVELVAPLPCIYAAATRKSVKPEQPAFFPEQSMTRQEALLSYTLWNAWAAFEEKEKGSLSAGKYADLVILDQDLLRCAPEAILQAKVLHTWVGGKLVYQHPE